MTGRTNNDWQRIVGVAMAAVLVLSIIYLVMLEFQRTSGRAEVERNMRANFENNLCPSEQIDGDICLIDPDRGMCISGEYIDYRTVWGRFTTVAGARRITAEAFREQGSLQRLANWFACQGFEENTSLRATRGPNFKSFVAIYSNGFGPFQNQYPPAPFGAIFRWYLGTISVRVNDEGQLIFVNATGNKNLSL